MKKNIKKLVGANMDINLNSNPGWKQDKCPWNVVENTKKHKCAVKNVNICKYFCGIAPLDYVLCSYPNKKI